MSDHYLVKPAVTDSHISRSRVYLQWL